MMMAAKLAIEISAPINRLLTINTQALRSMGVGGVFRQGHQADCVRNFMDLHRRWSEYRGIPWAAIWAREQSRAVGEHLHIGFHQDATFDGEHARQLSEWTDEPIDMPPFGNSIVAMSVDKSWQVKRCRYGGVTGQGIAAYLGKAEPSKIITAWGKIKPNERKPNRKHYGGTGLIEGTERRAYRWGTSRILGPLERDMAGLQPH